MSRSPPPPPALLRLSTYNKWRHPTLNELEVNQEQVKPTRLSGRAPVTVGTSPSLGRRFILGSSWLYFLMNLTSQIHVLLLNPPSGRDALLQLAFGGGGGGHYLKSVSSRRRDEHFSFSRDGCCQLCHFWGKLQQKENQPSYSRVRLLQ